MNQYFGYIRVSTPKQGERGVSLVEQRDAIERYAQRTGLTLARWFEERETAAKRGRPFFGQMIKLLRHGKARGVVIHKIDRSARNLRDWADLGELIDRGVDVHFANESLDLNSRGGRLSADIQAVVAADYVRNLREETKKGIYGRLKQGLYPMPAPLGYRDIGQGQAKQPDPVTGPLVRNVFELYATGRFNFDTLLAEAERLGLRSKTSKSLSRNGLSTVLNNPFYVGVIRIQKTGQSFTGKHQPLISKHLFDAVQNVLQGKTNTRTERHDLLFRRRLTCQTCGYHLIGEAHKSYVYYRCQSRPCPPTCLREEVIDAAIVERFQLLQFSPDEQAYLRHELDELRRDGAKQQEAVVASLELKLKQFNERLQRLTDAYIDRLIDQDLFEQRKTTLLMERREVQDSIADLKAGKRLWAEELHSYLERADGAYLCWKQGNVPEKRELVDAITSNRFVSGKSLKIVLASPFDEVANRFQNADGRPRRDAHRTWSSLLPRIMTALQLKQETQIRSAA